MSKKTTSTRRKASVSSAAVGKPRTVAAHNSKGMKRVGHDAGRGHSTVAEMRPGQSAGNSARATPTAIRSAREPRAAAGREPSAEILAKAEANISAAIESLNNQMNAAMTTLTELAVAQRGRNEVSIRTAPLDRATATFQRLVGEVLDEHLAQLLPPLVSLRNELAEKADGPAQSGEHDATFFRRGAEMLDQVLAGANVNRYDARPGETFDPLIHLAVGEMHRNDLADGAVAEFLQHGFRTTRGKVIAPAKVKVNRR